MQREKAEKSKKGNVCVCVCVCGVVIVVKYTNKETALIDGKEKEH